MDLRFAAEEGDWGDDDEVDVIIHKEVKDVEAPYLVFFIGLREMNHCSSYQIIKLHMVLVLKSSQTGYSHVPFFDSI